jgi:UDP:flavonoid glycosyltransferase YjiC (YdhE family)
MNPLFEGQHAPSRVLALFSASLAAPEPDWPPQTVITGFPFFDDGAMPVELVRFLDAGPAPIVFTLGSSAVGAAGNFYLDSLKAVAKLNARAVFLTGPHPQRLPRVLPDAVMAVSYAPHAALFGRAAALVHQGGVGTTAQAMRAGRPTLIVPFAHDQFDNAERVRRLGAAEVLPHSRYTARRAEARLRRLLTIPCYAHQASRIGEQLRAEDGAATAADAIEDTRFGDPVRG